MISQQTRHEAKYVIRDLDALVLRTPPGDTRDTLTAAIIVLRQVLIESDATATTDDRPEFPVEKHAAALDHYTPDR